MTTESVAAVPSTTTLMDEARIEELLSEKLMDGFLLLERACPRCITPLVQKQRPDPHNSSNNSHRHERKMDISAPIPGVPFCVSCRAHVMHNETDISRAQRHYHGQALHGNILIDFDVPSSNKKEEDETVATQNSSNYTPHPTKTRTIHDDDDDSDEIQILADDSDSVASTQSSQQFHQVVVPHTPRIDFADMDEIELICSRSMVSGVHYDNHDNDNNCDNDKALMVQAYSEAESVVMSAVESCDSREEESQPQSSAHSSGKLVVKAAPTGVTKSTAEASLVSSDVSKTVVKGRSIDTASTAPFTVVGGDSVAASQGGESTSQDEFWPSFDERKLIATKVLSVKMLQGHKLMQKQCRKCSMPLTDCQGEISCAVCPILNRRASKARANYQKALVPIESTAIHNKKKKNQFFENAKSRSTVAGTVVGTVVAASSAVDAVIATDVQVSAVPKQSSSSQDSQLSRPKLTIETQASQRSHRSQQSKLIEETKGLVEPKDDTSGKSASTKPVKNGESNVSSAVPLSNVVPDTEESLSISKVETEEQVPSHTTDEETLAKALEVSQQGASGDEMKETSSNQPEIGEEKEEDSEKITENISTPVVETETDIKSTPNAEIQEEETVKEIGEQTVTSTLEAIEIEGSANDTPVSASMDVIEEIEKATSSQVQITEVETVLQENDGVGEADTNSAKTDKNSIKETETQQETSRIDESVKSAANSVSKPVENTEASIVSVKKPEKSVSPQNQTASDSATAAIPATKETENLPKKSGALAKEETSLAKDSNTSGPVLLSPPATSAVAEAVVSNTAKSPLETTADKMDVSREINSSNSIIFQQPNNPAGAFLCSAVGAQKRESAIPSLNQSLLSRAGQAPKRTMKPTNGLQLSKSYLRRPADSPRNVADPTNKKEAAPKGRSARPVMGIAKVTPQPLVKTTPESETKEPKSMKVDTTKEEKPKQDEMVRRKRTETPSEECSHISSMHSDSTISTKTKVFFNDTGYEAFHGQKRNEEAPSGKAVSSPDPVVETPSSEKVGGEEEIKILEHAIVDDKEVEVKSTSSKKVGGEEEIKMLEHAILDDNEVENLMELDNQPKSNLEEKSTPQSWKEHASGDGKHKLVLEERLVSPGNYDMYFAPAVHQNTTTLPTSKSKSALAGFEARREIASKEIENRMMKGWMLLNSTCPSCAIPLMADTTGENELCVFCGRTTHENQDDFSSDAATAELTVDHPMDSSSASTKKRDAIDPCESLLPIQPISTTSTDKSISGEQFDDISFSKTSVSRHSARDTWSSIASRRSAHTGKGKQSDPPAVLGHTLRRRNAKDCDPQTGSGPSSQNKPLPPFISSKSARSGRDPTDDKDSKSRRKDPVETVARAPDPVVEREVIVDRSPAPDSSTSTGPKPVTDRYAVINANTASAVSDSNPATDRYAVTNSTLGKDPDSSIDYENLGDINNTSTRSKNFHDKYEAKQEKHLQSFDDSDAESAYESEVGNNTEVVSHSQGDSRELTIKDPEEGETFTLAIPSGFDVNNEAALTQLIAAARRGIPLNVETNFEEGEERVQRAASPGMSEASPLRQFPNSTTIRQLVSKHEKETDEPAKQFAFSPTSSKGRSRIAPESIARSRKSRNSNNVVSNLPAPSIAEACSVHSQTSAAPSQNIQMAESIHDSVGSLMAQSFLSPAVPVMASTSNVSETSDNSKEILIDLSNHPESPKSESGSSELLHDFSGSGSHISPISIHSSHISVRHHYRIQKSELSSAAPETIIILDDAIEEEKEEEIEDGEESRSNKTDPNGNEIIQVDHIEEEDSERPTTTTDIQEELLPVTSQDDIDALLARIEETQAQLAAAGEEADTLEKRQKLTSLLDRLSDAAAAVEELDDSYTADTDQSSI